MANVTNPSQAAAYLHTLAASSASRLLRRSIVLLCVALLAWVPGQPAIAQAPEDASSIEYRVKAAYLYRFAGYVGWPPSAFVRPDAPVTIAVMGAEGLATELEQVVIGRTVSDRTVAVKRIKPGDSLTGVNVLFVSKNETTQLAQLTQAAQTRSILTVTESAGALRQGSVINFTVADQRVRFEISLDAAEKNGIKLSSRLLAVAQQVVTGAP